MKLLASVISIILVSLLLQGCFGAKSAPTAVAQPAAPAPVVEPVVTTIGDSDGDGVNDDLDECANTRTGVEVDAKGCEIILRLSGPLFDFDKSTLTATAQSILTEAKSALARNPAKLIEVAGHTDSVGTESYNIKLGTRRSEAVHDFLIKLGIDGNRLKPTTYGESQPVASNNTSEGRALNRRVELIDTSN